MNGHRLQQLSRVILQCVWAEIAKLDDRMLGGIVTDELFQAASYAGCESVTCDVIADIFAVLSSLTVRTKLLGKVRTVRSSILFLGAMPLTSDLGSRISKSGD